MSAARWLLFLDRTMSLEDYFSDIHVPVNCEFLVAEEQDFKEGQISQVTLTEVFRVHRTHLLQTYSKGTWSSCYGFAWSTVPFDKRRGNLHGAVIPSGIYSAVSSVAMPVAGYGCASYVVQCESHTAQHTTHNHNQAHFKQRTTHTQKHDTLPQHQVNTVN